MTLSLRAESPAPLEGRRNLVLLEREIRARFRRAASQLAVLRGSHVEGPDTEVALCGLAHVLRDQNRPCLAVEFAGEGALKRLIFLVRQRDLHALVGLATPTEPADGELERTLVERALRTIAACLSGEPPRPGRVEPGHLALLSTLDARQVLAVTGTYRVHESRPEGSHSVRELPITVLMDARQGGEWLAQEAPAAPARRIALPAAPLASASAPDRRLVDRVPLPVRAVAGRCRVTLERLSRMGSGALLDFDCPSDAPIELEVEGRVVARGELVVSDGRYAVLVTEVLECLA